MIQYIHRNVQIQKGFKKTFAFKAPSAADMFKGIEKKLKGKEAFLKLEVGISHVHWKDNYCKKTGREYATERLAGKIFVITNVFFPEDPTKVDIVLVAKDDSMALRVGLAPGKEIARILAIELQTDGTGI